MKILSLLFFLLPVSCLAQFSIKGNIVNATDGKPISDASVFINNATIGTKSNPDGTFKLDGLNNGQYELIISVVGFERYRNTLVLDEDVKLPDIKLVPKIMMMNEVVIKAKDRTRARKIRLFKDYFLGRSSFANQCTLVNPDVLVLAFTKNEQVLSVHTNDFLEIDNNALGYKLKYLVADFVADKQQLNLGYEGYVQFEQKQGSPDEQRTWESNRRKAYLGSVTHFLREILADRLNKDYMVRSFCIKEMVDHKLIYDTLAPKNFVFRTNKKGIYALKYDEGLDVFYYPPGSRHSVYGEREKGNRGQVASMKFLDEFLYFDSRGTIINPTGALFNYTWSKSRVADLLPSDYWPDN